MARPPRVSSNAYSPEELHELFNVLSDWEAVLKHIDWDALEEPHQQTLDLNKRLPS